MTADGFRYEMADREDGIERSHRFLRDETDL